MPRGAFVNIHHCLHFADNWEEDDGEIWMDSFAEGKIELPVECAWQCRKFAILKDAFNFRWKDAVTPGWRLTMDKSQTPRWYKGPITQGPEPKPTRTGATMHTVFVMDRPLATYKLHSQTFGGKMDEDLQSCHVNTVTTGSGSI